MIKDSEWSKEYCNVTHMVKDGIQYSISRYDNFAELMIYSWHSHSIIKTLYFFIGKLEKDCYNEKTRFWNCSTQENAIKLAKHYCTGCMSIEHSKDNMKRFYCKEFSE